MSISNRWFAMPGRDQPVRGKEIKVVITLANPATEERARSTHVFHAVAVGSRWTWVLPATAYERLPHRQLRLSRALAGWGSTQRVLPDGALEVEQRASLPGRVVEHSQAGALTPRRRLLARGAGPDARARAHQA